MKGTAKWLMIASLAASPAYAEEEPTDSEAARISFQTGLERASRGELQAALAAFQEAYRARPHFSVLYNIGQAQAALGKYAEASDSFTRYLADGAESIGASRRAEVQGLLGSIEKHIGTLHIVLAAPERTRVWLDGEELGAAQLAAPIRASAGAHTILASDGTGFPNQRQALVQAASTTLVELPAASPQAKIDCSAPRDPRLSPAQAGWLRVVSKPADARIFVDGQHYRGGPLRFGRHAVTVERAGYLSRTKRVDLIAGRTLTLRVELERAAARHDELRQQAARRRTWAYVLSGGSLALLATGGALLTWNSRRYDRWQNDPSAGSQLETVASLQRVDDLGVGSLVVGGALGVGGALLFFDFGGADD